MRWNGLLVIAVVAVPLLAACDDKKDEKTATQKATPDNTPELTCRMIKECNDELQRRADEKHKKLWEGIGESQVQPSNVSVDTNSKGDASRDAQAEKPGQ